MILKSRQPVSYDHNISSVSTADKSSTSLRYPVMRDQLTGNGFVSGGYDPRCGAFSVSRLNLAGRDHLV